MSNKIHVKKLRQLIRGNAEPGCCADEDESGEKVPPRQYVQWASSDGVIFCPATQTRDKIPPGVYEIKISDRIGLYFEQIPVKTEGLIRFPETTSDKVVSEIQKFWTREGLFREFDLTYKRGIILYGPPGGGKSCTVQLIMADVVERGGIVVKFHNPYHFVEGMRVLRQVQKDLPVVAVMEDIDSLLEVYEESEVLNILDGIIEVDRVVFLATTNYPQDLGARIINRPSRFDKRFRIGFPTSTSRRIYFQYLVGDRDPETLGIDLERWVKDTSKFSIAHLKELFVAVVILGDEYKDAIKTLKAMKEAVEDKEGQQDIGFMQSLGNEEDDD